MPAPRSASGTPAVRSATDPAHTAAMLLLPLLPSVSAETRAQKGKASGGGISGASAFSARAPWPTSRRPGAPSFPTSPVQKGGKL